jgi:DNA-binding transcriptional ArsR family regulator
MIGETSFVGVAAVLGDPARARMLTALLDGRALTATELALAAAVAPSTASSHLARLERARLVAIERQGRHRYYRLAGAAVAEALEALNALAVLQGDGEPVRTGPRDPALREARVCYDHLAGTRGVRLFASLCERGLLAGSGEQWQLTEEGARALGRFGIDLDRLRAGRRPLCRACLDWSERRTHLGGALGAALLDVVFARGWARRERKSRVVTFSAAGAAAFGRAFPLRAAAA